MPSRAATVGRAVIGLVAVLFAKRNAGEKQGRAAAPFIQTNRRSFSIRFARA
jgi:hypothetical protein